AQARNFHTKIEFLEWFVEDGGVPFDVDFSHILWFHDLRNRLYHSGNGVVPELSNVEGARRAASSVFEALFGVDPHPFLGPKRIPAGAVATPGHRIHERRADYTRSTASDLVLRGDALAVRA